MNGPQHYREAEKLIAEAEHNPNYEGRVELIAAAQVHATLALAAASVDGPAVARYLGAIPGGDGDDIRPVDRAWADVTA